MSFQNSPELQKKALRHYEKMHLLQPFYNPDNGYRRYKDSDIHRLELILSLKMIGFELHQISVFFKNNQNLKIIDFKFHKTSS